MKITISGRKVTLKEPFKERVEKKLHKLDRFFEEDAEARVTVGIERDRQTVEITIKNKGMIYRTEETTRDMLQSFDTALDAMMRQISKNKAKLTKRLRAGAFEGMPQEEQEAGYDIVKVKRFSLKPMDVEEAILQMNLSGHEFYTFLNSQSDQVNVVYRRKDGRYGVLEPVL